MYSEKLLEHGKNPRNFGDIPHPDGVATVASKIDGDLATVFLRIREERIVDIKAKVFGCLAAKAACSVMTELAKDVPIREALNLTRNDVANALGGLHKLKMHVAELAEEGLHSAIKDYLSKREKEKS